MIEFHPNAWGWLILGAHALMLVPVAFLHGLPRRDPWDFRSTVFQTISTLIVLYMAGAFTSGCIIVSAPPVLHGVERQADPNEPRP